MKKDTQMKKYLLLLTIFLQFSISYAQTPITFQKTYGIGIGKCVQQTTDKGFILLGYSEGSTTIISLIKTDSIGVIEWSKSYASGSDELRAYSIQQTNDGGYIITGNIVYSPVSIEDIILLKTTSNGTLQWKKYFNFTSIEYGFSVQQTIDGGFIITGVGYTDLVLIKTAADGTMQWAKTIAGTSGQEGKSVKQTSDGGFIITGFTTSFGAGSFDVYLVKTDSIGTLQWTKTFGGTNDDFGNSIQLTLDGGYIIAGTTRSYGAGIGDVYIIKTTSNGTLQWTKTFGGTLNEEGYSVQQTSDFGFIISGLTRSFGTGSDDIYLVKTDSNGTMQWTKTFGGLDAEAGYSVAQTHDGGYVINGNSYSSFATFSTDIYFIKTDSNGNSGCNETSPTSIEGSGGTEGFGGTEDSGGTTGNLFVQTNFGSAANTLCTTVGLKEISEENLISIFPNPFSTMATLQTEKKLKGALLTIFNSHGKQVNRIKNINGQTITITRDNLAAGLYFLRLSQGSKIIATEKLIITD